MITIFTIDMETVISENEDIIIPREIWKKAEFSPGDHVMISVIQGKIIIVPEKLTVVSKFKALAEKVQINDYQSDKQYDLELQERLGL
ncbi:AbrB/MazE/SpoVT family DNA-binding domain-containing protein [Methanospirillum purgamenti]|jgi:bifunctional DNA-binding transcriptional regulator/antitoxin component of YhaV-PrlF toxin-antitoxin module|uniref:AbrB/MazE/SpoVT family DNA-binding domain-containing protein n=1 Tax=Methanospirillum hungatei TaxID=2203 RepID=A0A8F5ZFQ7_METHU|nr:AbrB/MazE/SpoVT family DNA-binding domain-containing protein [Methanospirillum hungatei]QXO94779.1 AbrB/MazE/SpoVT family DNA-binding domain-containing protein [Methanospirillum hungatei]